MRGIKKHFGATVALAGVDLEVRAGEILALVGENGAGKSTLMKILAGVHPAGAGAMELDGLAFEPAHPLAARRAGIAMIHQELALAPHLSVEENLLLGVEPARGPFLRRAEARRRASMALAAVGLPGAAPDTPIRRLSTAQRQLVEVGRALVTGCRVLVLDEPTSSLTHADIARLFSLIVDLKKRGIAIIYISHFLEEIREISDRYHVLRDGLSVGDGRTADATTPEIAALMVGRDIKEMYPRSRRQPGAVLLDIRALAGRLRPVDASICVRRGEIVGIAGLIGAGRTELLRAVFGLDPVRSGEIRVGAFSGRARPRDRWRQGTGFVSEDRQSEGLAVTLPLCDNLMLSRLNFLVTPRAQEAASQRWIERLSITCRSPWQPVGELSGGNQQKVSLGRLLHHDVDLFLLDEPTRGIDIGAKALIYRLLDELALQGKAILIAGGYLPELLGICDRIAVMCRGVLGPARPVAETDEHSIMLEATGGNAAAKP